MVNRAGHVEALYTLARLSVGSSSGRVDPAKGKNCIFQSNIDETSSGMLEASPGSVTGPKKAKAHPESRHFHGIKNCPISRHISNLETMGSKAFDGEVPGLC